MNYVVGFHDKSSNNFLAAGSASTTAIGPKSFFIVFYPENIPLFYRALFSSNGSLRHCIAKSKLMNILNGLLPQQQPKTTTVLNNFIPQIHSVAEFLPLVPWQSSSQ
ncbi:hypothetical protein ACROYT_G010509 [Oculina patagonica]